MAPRRGGGGGGGGGSSGSAGCDGCNVPLTLYGSDWTDPATLATFVIYCISLLMVFIALFGVAFYGRWRAANGRSGKYSLGTYVGAVILTLINLALSITNVALSEEGTTVTRAYYVLFVFSLAAALFGTILTLILVAQFVESALSARSRPVGLGIKLVGILLTLLAIAYLALYIRVTAYNINPDDDASYTAVESWGEAMQAISVTFDSIVLLTLFFILVLALKAFRSANQSKAYRLVALIAVLAFILAWIFAVALDGVYLDQYVNTNSYGYGVSDIPYNFIYAAICIQSFFWALVLLLCFVLAFLGSRGRSNVNPDGYVYTKPSAHTHNGHGNTALNP